MYHPPYFWKRTPFVRLIVPFIAGIVLQWISNFNISTLYIVCAIVASISLIFSWLPFAVKYTYRWILGISINCLLFIFGALICYNKDIRNRPEWIGNYTADSMTVLATIKEPLVQKAKTYKAEASVDAVNVKGEWSPSTGTVLIYFSKDSNVHHLSYGSQVLFNKPLEPIKNSGNPGSFDYKQYCAFKDIYHHVFLKKTEYLVTGRRRENAFYKWLLDVRFAVISRLKQQISGEREAGVAEALLIGYRDDLDKNLVQAYSNTGVVHIIAISGLHLGMIYGSLLLLFKPIRRYKWSRWLKPTFILAVLWIFTLLAGGVPSILRSAVMFSFIIAGEAINKKSSIYNTLAASAFVMLCFNPFYLWDVGFQLSYAAVISIITFSKPVYNWFDVTNKIIVFFWKLASVTIAAQILTLPIIFYTFHQFPNLFLITNSIIVPLSSVILFAELALLIASFMPAAAKALAVITGSLLSLMNHFIEWINRFPFAVYDGIQMNLCQTVFLYVFVVSICYWMLQKRKPYLFAGLTAMFIVIIIDNYEKIIVNQQNKIIVYNIPRRKGIDFISGKQYAFTGDSALSNDSYLSNLYLRPSRTLQRIEQADNVDDLSIINPFIKFKNKRILMLEKSYEFQSSTKIDVDLIIVSHNPRLNIADLHKVFNCKQYVFDGSNSTWKINRWKKDCDSLHLRYYSTPDEGAFELNLQ